MADRTRARSTTHACPGRCGEQVPRHRLACRSCWRLLPAPDRAALARAFETDPAAHVELLQGALTWYREHVVNGHLVQPTTPEDPVTDEVWEAVAQVASLPAIVAAVAADDPAWSVTSLIQDSVRTAVQALVDGGGHRG